MPDVVEPIVIRESRLKAGLMALGSVLLLWGCSLALRGPKANPFAGYLGFAIFGASAVVTTIQVFRPSTLTLDSTGFSVDQLWLRRHVRWEQASNFHVGHSSRGFARYVAYDCVPDSEAWGGLNRWGRLPGNWTLSPPALVALMIHCKARWGSAGPALVDPP